MIIGKAEVQGSYKSSKIRHIKEYETLSPFVPGSQADETSQLSLNRPIPHAIAPQEVEEKCTVFRQ